MTELITKRLRLRKITSEDFELMRHLDTDTKVLEFIAPPFPLSRTEARMKLIEKLNQSELTLGYWMGEILDTKEAIGWFVLNNIQQTETIEIGYRLKVDSWGKGFATEGAKAVLHHGFNDLALEQIVGITNPGNEGSKKVLRKIRLKEDGMRHFYDQEVSYFELTKNRYLNQ